MIAWLKKLFEKKWEVRPCGCRVHEAKYSPLEVQRCPKHEEEFRERMKALPEQPKVDDSYFFIPFMGA